MSFRNIFLAALAVLALGALPAGAQEPKIDPEQRHLLLATAATATMQIELEKAASQGFRVVMGTSRENSEIVLLLQRDPQPRGKYQYKLLATTDTITFQKEIDEAARQGYRAVRHTFITKPHVMSAPEIVVVVERAPGQTKRYDYKLLATTLTSTLEKEWAVEESRGFQAIGMVTRVELMVLLEREAKSQS